MRLEIGRWRTANQDIDEGRRGEITAITHACGHRSVLQGAPVRFSNAFLRPQDAKRQPDGLQQVLGLGDAKVPDGTGFKGSDRRAGQAGDLGELVLRQPDL